MEDQLSNPLCSLGLYKMSFYAEEHGAEARIKSLPDLTSLDSSPDRAEGSVTSSGGDRETLSTYT